METVVNAVHKVTWHKGQQAPADRTIGGPDGLLSRLAPFVSTTKSFRAARRYPVSFTDSTGRLGSAWTERIRDDKPVYVVYSYRTPIAWVSWPGDMVVVPLEETDGGASQTTRTHSNAVRAWLPVRGCDHGGRLYECLAFKAQREHKILSEGKEVPLSHGETWLPEW